jgi:hypothetical protein
LAEARPENSDEQSALVAFARWRVHVFGRRLHFNRPESFPLGRFRTRWFSSGHEFPQFVRGNPPAFTDFAAGQFALDEHLANDGRVQLQLCSDLLRAQVLRFHTTDHATK